MVRCQINNRQCQKLISHADLYWQLSQIPLVKYLIPLHDEGKSFAPLKWPFEKKELTHDTIMNYYLEAESNPLTFEIKESDEEAIHTL